MFKNIIALLALAGLTFENGKTTLDEGQLKTVNDEIDKLTANLNLANAALAETEKALTATQAKLAAQEARTAELEAENKELKGLPAEPTPQVAPVQTTAPAAQGPVYNPQLDLGANLAAFSKKYFNQ